MALNIIKNKLNKIKNNHLKSKTFKFKLLRIILEKNQNLIIDINNIKADALMSINLKTDISEINMDNLIRKNISFLYSKISSLQLFIEKSIIKCEKEDFGKEILKIIEILKQISSEIAPIDKIYDNKKLVIKKLNISKENLELIERNLVILEKKDLSYFEDVKIPEKRMMSDLLKKQKI